MNYEPRNARSIVAAKADGTLEPGETVIVSLVGDCDFAGMKVYADPGKRYDWSCLAGQMACLVVNAADRQDARLFGDVFAASMPYPSIVVLDRQVVGSIVDCADGFKLWQRRRGSEAWQAVFA